MIQRGMLGRGLAAIMKVVLWLLREGRPIDGKGILLVEVAGLRTTIGNKDEVGFVLGAAH